MSLKVVLFLGLLAVNIGTNTSASEINNQNSTKYLVPAEQVGREITMDEIRTLQKEHKFENLSLAIHYRIAIKPERQLDFQQLLPKINSEIISEDKNKNIYEILPVSVDPINHFDEFLAMNIVDSLTVVTYYMFDVKPEGQLTFEEFLREKDVPVRRVQGEPSGRLHVFTENV